VNLAGETDLRSAIDAMFNGDKINMTEGAPYCTPPCATAPTVPSRLTART
jgi:glucose-6-phosphate isomerase